jgi:hypothetical protein
MPIIVCIVPLVNRRASAASVSILQRLDSQQLGQPGRALLSNRDNNNNDMREESPGRDSDPRPLPLWGNIIRCTNDEPYLTKVTLYQAELPRQLDEQSSQ